MGVFGFLHPARRGGQGTSIDPAVILCPPFGWEEVGSYRARRTWAARLAEEGITTLRIDFLGTGNSAGNAHTPELLKLWKGTVASAADWLRGERSCGRVTAIGLGLGGQVALLACAERAAIDELVLWSVPRSGRALLRELRAFARFEQTRLEEEGEAVLVPGDDGALHVGGYSIAAETVAELERVDLTTLELGDTQLRRVLLLGRDAAPPDARLATALRDQHLDVEMLPGIGYSAMTAEPQRARPALETFSSVSSWLSSETAGSVDPGAGGAQSGVCADEDGPHGPLGTERLEASATARITVGATVVRETALSFDVAASNLFGVLTEPLERPAERCVVLLNAGGQRHTGPNRMWVEAARRWAPLGLACLRLDVEGIGDGEAAPGSEDTEWEDDARFYVDSYVTQIRAVLDRLSERGLPPRVQLVGLCSGAYWSLRTAVADDRVESVCMLNPRALVFDRSLSSAREARKLRKLTSAATWKRVARGETPLYRPFTIGAAMLRNAAIQVRRRSAPQRSLTPGAELDELFERLRDLGKPGLLVFSGAEPLDFEFDREGRFERFGMWPNITLERIGGAAETHTLQPLAVQRQAAALLDRAVAEARNDAPSSAHVG